jgi:hypothetical protein
MLPAIAEVRDVEQVRVGDNRHLSPADWAMRDDSAAADPAPAK